MQFVIDTEKVIMMENLVLILIDTTDVGIINEVNDSRYRNRGVVKALSAEAEEAGIKKGDMVHFGDMAGAFPFKKKNRNYYVLHKAEIALISDDSDLYLGEDLSFYMAQDLAGKQAERIARI